nr:hypothetical protein [Actinotignum schaalii]
MFGGAAVRFGIRGEIAALHIRPRQEERDVFVDLRERSDEGITRFRIEGGEAGVIGGNNETGVVADRGVTGFEVEGRGGEVAGGFADIQLVFPRDFVFSVGRNVDRAGGGGTQTGDGGL